MTPSSFSPREVEYDVFVEVIHGRWVRLDVIAPSPQGALAQVRKRNLNGKVVAVKAKATYEFDKEGDT